EKYDGVEYPAHIKCAIPSEKDRFTSAPSAAQRKDWCQRPLRTKGDINGDGIVDSQDYASYIRIVNGSKVNPNFIPDVNGDGVVSPEDRDIVVRTLRSSF
ncbi:MAG: dockerin type I domain-containing protein, partial [bacterium]|nr:dockerin type I domain-containing protein [bacterium]